MLKLDWGDAQVWMDIATTLYMRNAPNPPNPPNPEVLPRRTTAYPQVNELNVAAVCAGYAFELIYKVLVRVGGRQHKGQATSLAEHMRDSLRQSVQRSNGLSPATDGETLLNYWHISMSISVTRTASTGCVLHPRKLGGHKGCFDFDGRKRIDALKRLHKDLSALALKRINERPDGSEEVWPGTDLP